MPTVDLVVRNGWVITPGGRLLGGVAIDGERIVHVGPEAGLPPAHRQIDAREQYVIPGLIDPHIHMTSEEAPSLTAGLEQNVPVETLGMVHGGVTTFGHFCGAFGRPLAAQISETVEALNRWSYADCLLHGLILDAESLAAQEQAWRLGVTSFKHFFTAYGRRQFEDPGLGGLFAPVDSGMLLRSMQWIAARGAPGIALVHAEDGDVIGMCTEQVQRTARADLAAWSEARPSLAEWTNVQHAIALAAMAECPLYVVHMSAAESCALVAKARAAGQPVWSEVGPQWLTHHDAMESQIGCWGKVNPPLRKPADAQALWRGFHNGGVTCLGTDHGTGGRTRSMKEKAGGKHDNIWAARPGIRGGPGHLLGALMTYGVHAGRITIEDVVRCGSLNTAKALGLYPRKGVLTAGADADVVIVDPDLEAVVDSNFYRAPCEVSIYEGHRLRGLARTIVVRGRIVVEDGETVGRPGWGRYIARGVRP